MSEALAEKAELIAARMPGSVISAQVVRGELVVLAEGFESMQAA